MDAFETLWRGDCRGLHAANQALISLPLKHVEAVVVKDFRPINLIQSVVKLVAKVMSVRLAPIMSILVGLHQSAFISGRCLHDNFQLVRTTARKLQSNKRSAIMLKLDYQGIRHHGLGFPARGAYEARVREEMVGHDLWVAGYLLYPCGRQWRSWEP